MRRVAALAPTAALALVVAGAAGPAGAGEAPGAARQRELLRLVRQDCGACHGMRLAGGLGPALESTRLKDWPVESLVATILRGRAGTPMPGWAPMLSDADALWIARQLQDGLPGAAP